ncbi:TPA: hypothetical protein CPT80_06845 [Candidatus Gastranaerophilales bacterium HUM_9]|nr:MAG TPA: hypothetical protein CPT80_06845 [Candidatus Gastranaerophilales bacterium HUM_9]HBX35288.1 hypothetical protein [Cyanobacteria bacterium UBA11440]
MAEMFNNLSGDSSAQYNNYNNNGVQGAKVNAGGKDGGYSHDWKRAPRPFGLNVRVPQAPVGTRSQKLVAEIIKEMAMAPITPVIDYFKTNENIFNGNVAKEIASIQKQQKITVELLQDADDVVMSEAPSFMMDM